MMTYLTEKGIDLQQIEQVLKQIHTATTEPKEQEMFIQPQSLKQQTKKHFGLVSNPFMQDVSSEQQMFKNNAIHYVRAELLDAVKNNGFKAIIGESGAGKTTIREAFIEDVEQSEKPFIIIQPNINCSADSLANGKILKAQDIEEAIIQKLSPLTKPKRGTQARAEQIKQLLTDSHKAGNQHLLLIEEAHSLALPTLRHLKRFHETKLGRSRLLSIVLIGQPELEQKLSPRNREIIEVSQRCEIVALEPLQPHDIAGYLTVKLQDSPLTLEKLIDQSGIEAIARKLTQVHEYESNRRKQSQIISLLYPLAINNLMSKAMNKAAELGLPIINADLIMNT